MSRSQDREAPLWREKRRGWGAAPAGKRMAARFTRAATSALDGRRYISWRLACTRPAAPYDLGMIRSAALFLIWAVVGFIASFALLYGFTPVGPVIVLVVWLAYRYLPRISGTRFPEAIGTLGGFGAFLLLLATAVDGDSSPFAIVGALAVAASIAGYLAARRMRCGNRLAAG